jgi:uncharacterized protein YndB with AHSA1/START domain
MFKSGHVPTFFISKLDGGMLTRGGVMSEKHMIQIECIVEKPISQVWTYWNEPSHIVNWSYASEDWHSPSSENDLRVGGQFKNRMEAKDGSMGFDFEGIYTEVILHEKIAFKLGDEREVIVNFHDQGDQTHIVELFVPENVFPQEQQREGWQAILNHFKAYAVFTLPA